MIYPFASRCTILCFFIYYSPRNSFRFALDFFFTVQQLIIMYNFKLMIRCIKNLMFINPYKTTINENYVYNSYKDGDVCRGMLFINSFFSFPKFVRQDILEITALISVNVRLQDVCVYIHMTAQFAIILQVEFQPQFSIGTCNVIVVCRSVFDWLCFICIKTRLMA